MNINHTKQSQFTVRKKKKKQHGKLYSYSLPSLCMFMYSRYMGNVGMVYNVVLESSFHLRGIIPVLFLVCPSVLANLK